MSVTLVSEGMGDTQRLVICGMGNDTEPMHPNLVTAGFGYPARIVLEGMGSVGVPGPHQYPRGNVRYWRLKDSLGATIKNRKFYQ